MKIPKFKRLKIAEQIIIVLLVAVLTPLVTIGVIINNVSQQSVRKELKYSAEMISQFVGNMTSAYLYNADNSLSQIAMSLNHFYFKADRQQYLKEITAKNKKFKNLQIADKSKTFDVGRIYNAQDGTMRIQTDINADEVLIADVNMDALGARVFEMFKDDKRQIYVLDIDNSVVAAHNPNDKDLAIVLNEIPKRKEVGKAVIFGKIKNQPMAFYKLKDPAWTVVVNTTSKITNTTINHARFNIILSILIAGLCIIFVFGLYIYYLYLNMRQLFKAIIALSKGNYERRIRLLSSVFTPHEVIFLAQEFNKMAHEINKSYSELNEKNLELKRLDEFRSNLVSAVSHEFRTPLTSIMGYSSRLLRHDIDIDEETRHKSLKVIKQQSERLSRMVEDLLVIPEIESFRLKLNPVEVDLARVVELCISFVDCPEERFTIQMPDAPVFVTADKDRLIQVVVNLLDNALKYSPPDSQIGLKAFEQTDSIVLTVTNSAADIPEEMLEKLFEKFTRIDDKMTRTTRGVGLGLYIVRGLCMAMGAKVSLESQNGFFSVKLELQSAKKIHGQSSRGCTQIG